MRRNRLLTLCAALWLAISPALAVTYAVRNNTRLTRTGTAPAFASTWTVTVYENGAIATANSTGTTITVASGHGFTTGDKLMVGTDPTTYRTVSSTGATSVVVNSAVTVTSGTAIVNLGADTGSGTPSYDGSNVSIYQYSDGTGAYTQSRVTLDSQGRYGYWVDNTLTVMELFRNSAGVPDSIMFVSVAGGGGGGGSGTFTNACTTDRGIIVADGTDTTDGTCPTATISNSGAVSIVESAAPTTGDNPAFNLSASDTSSGATQITYPTASQVNLYPLRFIPNYRVANTAASVYFKGIQLDVSGYNTGDFDNWSGVSVDLAPNTNAFSGTRYFSASTSLTLFNANFSLDNQVGTSYPDVALFRGGATDDVGSGLSTWTSTSFSTFKSDAASLQSGFWSGIATITRGYGLNVADAPSAGANIVNWWGAYLGGPLAIEDNSVGGAAYDTRGYVAWATDDSRFLSSATDTSGDGTTDSTSAVNARFRWNDDNTRFEWDDCTTSACTTRWRFERGSSITKFFGATADDKTRLSGTDTTLGETYIEVDNNSATPVVHTNLGITSDPSTTLVNGIIDVQPNDDSQSPTCTSGKLCIYDNDGSASDDWAAMNGTSPATLNVGGLTMEGATADASELTFAVEEPTVDSTVTLPMSASGRPPIILFNQVTPVTVNGAASATLVSTTSAVGTPTLPAGYFNAIGKGFSFDARGTMTTDASPSTSDWIVQVGSVTVLSATTLTLPTSFTATGWHMTGACTALTVGSGTSTTLWCQAELIYRDDAAAGASTIRDFANAAVTSGFSNATTQDVDIEVNVASSGDAFKMTNFTITSIW